MKQVEITQDYVNAMRSTKKKFQRHEHIAQHKRKVFGNSINKVKKDDSDDEGKDEKDNTTVNSKQKTTNKRYL